jgi:acyl-CoA thioester hydrolase
VTTDSTTVSPAPLHHDVEFRVRYAETDQMGIVHHATYLIWCEVGRTDFSRARGMSYAEMERAGVLLAVSELTVRFHSAARFDDDRVRTRSPRFAPVESCSTISSRERLTVVARERADFAHRDRRSGRPIALPPPVRALFGRAVRA